MFRAFAELLTASQRDLELAEALGEMLSRVYEIFDPAIDHYFEPTSKNRDELRILFLEVSCLMLGLSAQAHLLKNRTLLEATLQLWLKQAASMVRARKGVTTPPPRPESFDHV
jgi:hypothetical protein